MLCICYTKWYIVRLLSENTQCPVDSRSYPRGRGLTTGETWEARRSQVVSMSYVDRRMHRLNCPHTSGGFRFHNSLKSQHSQHMRFTSHSWHNFKKPNLVNFKGLGLAYTPLAHTACGANGQLAGNPHSAKENPGTAHFRMCRSLTISMTDDTSGGQQVIQSHYSFYCILLSTSSKDQRIITLT